MTNNLQSSDCTLQRSVIGPIPDDREGGLVGATARPPKFAVVFNELPLASPGGGKGAVHPSLRPDRSRDSHRIDDFKGG